MLFPKIIIASALLAITNALQVDSPASLTQCQPVSLTWSGGASGPYYIAILPGGNPSAAALENLPNANSSPVTWTVDQPAGTSITIKITDGSGVVQYSSAVTVQAGSNSACLAASASASASASGSASNASSASASATGSTSGSASASGTSASASASAKASSGALGSKQVSGMMAGLVLAASWFGF